MCFVVLLSLSFIVVIMHIRWSNKLTPESSWTWLDMYFPTSHAPHQYTASMHSTASIHCIDSTASMNSTALHQYTASVHCISTLHCINAQRSAALHSTKIGVDDASAGGRLLTIQAITIALSTAAFATCFYLRVAWRYGQSVSATVASFSLFFPVHSMLGAFLIASLLNLWDNEWRFFLAFFWVAIALLLQAAHVRYFALCCAVLCCVECIMIILMRDVDHTAYQ